MGKTSSCNYGWKIPSSAFCCTSYYTVSTKYCRNFRSDHNHNPKTLPRIEKPVQESKSVLDSGKYFAFLELFLDSNKYFLILGSILDPWNCFWILGRVLDSGKSFWIMGSVLDSGICFHALGHVLDSGKYFWIQESALDSGVCFGFGDVFCP